MAGKERNARTSVLRAKYLGYCSAGDAELGPDELPSFNAIVQLATERLAVDPGRSERELTGLRRRGSARRRCRGWEERPLIPQKGRSSSGWLRPGGDDGGGGCTGGPSLPGPAPTSDPPLDPSMTISCTAMSVQYLVPP